MIRRIASCATLALVFAATASATVTFDWATVRNPGNGRDTTFGAVDYVYRISKYEVTNAQYTEFLNAVDPTGANPNLGGADPFLYNSAMSTDPNGGINLNSGAPDGSKYQVKSGRDENPVIYVSFFDAMRFTNWLENGQSSGSTESGVYTFIDGLREIRSPIATYFIPNLNEWHKAAFHKNDGVTANYWDYPTSTNALPFSDQPPGSGAPTQSNTANFFMDDGVPNGYDDGFAVTGSTSFSSSQNYLTDVGAYTASPSPYGTFDQAGSVAEWIEGTFKEARGLWGGDWHGDSFNLYALNHGFTNPSNELNVSGFRIASAIPEPSAILLLCIGALGVTVLRGRPRWSFSGSLRFRKEPNP